MKQTLLVIVAVMFTLSANAQDVLSTFVRGGTGTASATAIIPKGLGQARVTDLSYKLDGGTTTGVIAVYPGKQEVAITSATSGSGTTVWFDNSNSIVATGDYLIFNDVSLGTYTLVRVVTANGTTSATLQETISVAQTTSDLLFTTTGRFLRHAPQMTTSSTVQPLNGIWLPSSLPSAVSIDGNTTSCSVFISGTRTKDN